MGRLAKSVACIVVLALLSALAAPVVRACVPSADGLFGGVVTNVLDELPGGG